MKEICKFLRTLQRRTRHPEKQARIRHHFWTCATSSDTLGVVHQLLRINPEKQIAVATDFVDAKHREKHGQSTQGHCHG